MKLKKWRQGVILSCNTWELLASILWSGSLAQSHSESNKKKPKMEESFL